MKPKLEEQARIAKTQEAKIAQEEKEIEELHSTVRNWTTLTAQQATLVHKIGAELEASQTTRAKVVDN